MTYFGLRFYDKDLDLVRDQVSIQRVIQLQNEHLQKEH